jgi:hypothetical protein
LTDLTQKPAKLDLFDFSKKLKRQRKKERCF